jgi:phosphopantothenoylcysteine decarboxylase/phosphopantothenate--cysteine ligase
MTGRKHRAGHGARVAESGAALPRPRLALADRLVVLGVTGSIAAYKAAELCRALVAEGADVQVLLTHSAAQFVGPLTFETLTRRRVMLDPLELLPDHRIAHIVAADAADAIVVAPATARWLAAMASGLADDVVTATCLASAAPVVVAPAMDGEMYRHPATRANVERVKEFGYVIVEPESGPLASGSTGQGRLAEPGRIAAAAIAAVEGRQRRRDRAAWPPLDESIREQDLDGRRIVVTAGGTAEPIDPVRFIGNRSTGRMGVALAQAALARGAHVTLVAGTTSVPLPEAPAIVRAPTAAEMREAVLQALAGADALIMAAAVADFRPRRRAERKLAREGSLTLDLEPTEDILEEVSRRAGAMSGPDGRRPVVVGFAAETGSLDRAAEKVARKRLDLLVANDVAEEGSGFGTETNRVTLFAPGTDPDRWPMLPKEQVAHRILDRVGALLLLRDASEPLPERAPVTAVAP